MARPCHPDSLSGHAWLDPTAFGIGGRWGVSARRKFIGSGPTVSPPNRPDTRFEGYLPKYEGSLNNGRIILADRHEKRPGGVRVPPLENSAFSNSSATPQEVMVCKALDRLTG